MLRATTSSGRLCEVILPLRGVVRLYSAVKGVDGVFFCNQPIGSQYRTIIREPHEIVMLLMVPHLYESMWSVVLYEDSLCFILTNSLMELCREESNEDC